MSGIVPGTKSPNQVDVAVVDDGFDPKNPGAFKGDPNSLTPDEKKDYNDYLAAQAKRQAAKQRNAGNRNNQPPPGFNLGGIGPGGGFPGGPRCAGNPRSRAQWTRPETAGFLPRRQWRDLRGCRLTCRWAVVVVRSVPPTLRCRQVHSIRPRRPTSMSGRTT